MGRKSQGSSHGELVLGQVMALRPSVPVQVVATLSLGAIVSGTRSELWHAFPDWSCPGSPHVLQEN